MHNVKTRSDHIFDIINYTFFVVLAITMIYPIWHQVCLSFSDSALAKTGGFFFWPRGFTTAGYKIVLGSRYIWRAFINSVIITVAGVFFGVLFSCGIAFLLSKRNVPGSGILMRLVLFSFLFTGGIIPTYMVVKMTGLVNSLWALVIPILFAPYNIIIIRNYMQSLPLSLEESALIDGAGYFTIFFKLVMPLSKPIIATVAIWVAVSQWNGYMNGLLYIHDKDWYILPLLVREIVMGASDMAEQEVAVMTNADVINAVTVVVATVPIMVVYPFLQKYFTKGIMLGAVKG